MASSSRSQSFKKLSSMDNREKRLLRVHRRSVDQREMRQGEMNRRRQMEDMSPVLESRNGSQNPSSSVTPVKKMAALSRLERLKKWKEDRELKRKLQAMENARSKPSFKVTHVEYRDNKLYQGHAGVALNRQTKQAEDEQNQSHKPMSSQAKKQGRTNTGTQVARVTRSAALQKFAEPATLAASRRTRSQMIVNQPAMPREVHSQAVVDKPMKLAEQLPVQKMGKTSRMASAATTRTCSSVSNKKGALAAVRGKRNEVKSTKPGDVSTSLDDRSHTAVRGKRNEVKSTKPGDVSTSLEPSFAPDDFIFEVPGNLASYVFKPLSPTSAASFLFPHSNGNNTTMSAFTDRVRRTSTPSRKWRLPAGNKQLDHSEDKETIDQCEDRTVTDHSEGRDMADQLKNKEITDQLKNEEITDQLKNEEITDQLKNKEIADQLKNEEIADQLKNEEITDQLKNEEITDQLKNAEIANQLKNEEIADQLKNEEIADQLKNEEIADQLKNKEIADQLKNEEIADQLKNEEITDQLKNEEIADQLKNEEITDQLENKEITDQFEGRAITDQCEDRTITDQSEGNEITDQSEGREITDQFEDREMTDHSEGREMTDHSEGREMTDQSEGRVNASIIGCQLNVSSAHTENSLLLSSPLVDQYTAALADQDNGSAVAGKGAEEQVRELRSRKRAEVAKISQKENVNASSEALDGAVQVNVRRSQRRRSTKRSLAMQSEELVQNDSCCLSREKLPRGKTGHEDNMDISLETTGSTEQLTVENVILNRRRSKRLFCKQQEESVENAGSQKKQKRAKDDLFLTPGPPPPSSHKSSRSKRRQTTTMQALSSASSPEEAIKIISTSPMVEMTRRTPKSKFSPELLKNSVAALFDEEDFALVPLKLSSVFDATVSETVCNDNTTVSETVCNDSTTVSETVCNDNTTVSETVCNNSTTVSETVCNDSTTVSETVCNDNTTVSETVCNNSTTVSETVCNNSTTVSETVCNDSTTVSETVCNDSTTVSETVCNDSTTAAVSATTSLRSDQEDNGQATAVASFREKMAAETLKLIQLAEHWRSLRKSTSEITDEVGGEIDTTVCQAQLLMSQKGKFQQFSGLMDTCQAGNPSVTCQDLQGFWDLIFIQVADIYSKFSYLEQLRHNHWQADVAPKPVSAQRLTKKVSVAEARGGSKLKPVAKSRFAQFKAVMKQGKAKQEPAEEKVFDGGFFAISSPIKSPAYHCEGGTPVRRESSKFTSETCVDANTTRTAGKENVAHVLLRRSVGATPAGRSYIPAVPSPLLQDAVISCPMPLAQKSQADSEIEQQARKLVDTPVRQKRMTLARRSTRGRKSVCIVEPDCQVLGKEEEAVSLLAYCQPSSSITSPLQVDLQNSSPFSCEDVITQSKLDTPVSATLSQQQAVGGRRKSSLKVLLTTERRKSRRSVNFTLTSEEPSCNVRGSLPCTPYNRNSLVAERRVSRCSVASPSELQQLNNRSHRKHIARPSLLYTPPCPEKTQTDSPAQDVPVATLIAFSP